VAKKQQITNPPTLKGLNNKVLHKCETSVINFKTVKKAACAAFFMVYFEEKVSLFLFFHFLNRNQSKWYHPLKYPISI
jgi:hypothetical protein